MSAPRHAKGQPVPHQDAPAPPEPDDVTAALAAVPDDATITLESARANHARRTGGMPRHPYPPADHDRIAAQVSALPSARPQPVPSFTRSKGFIHPSKRKAAFIADLRMRQFAATVHQMGWTGLHLPSASVSALPVFGDLRVRAAGQSRELARSDAEFRAALGLPPYDPEKAARLMAGASDWRADPMAAIADHDALARKVLELPAYDPQRWEFTEAPEGMAA